MTMGRPHGAERMRSLALDLSVPVRLVGGDGLQVLVRFSTDCVTRRVSQCFRHCYGRQTD